MQNNHNLNLDEIVTLSVKAFKSENFDLHQYYLELLENLDSVEIPNKCSLDDLKNEMLKKKLC